MSRLDAIRVEVEKLKTVKASVKAYIVRTAADLEEHKNEPAEISAIAAEMRSEVDEIANDVVANTPAENQPG